jgi:GTP-binding protein
MSAINKFGSMELCQDIMQFIIELPPQEESVQEDEDVSFTWDNSNKVVMVDEIDSEDDFDDDDDDDDEDDDHPNVIYTNK